MPDGVDDVAASRIDAHRPGWLMAGAIREDDDPDSSDPSPNDDPYDSRLHRVYRHFFDPYNNAPMTVHGVTPCVSDGGCDRAPDWALGDTDYRAQPPLSNAERRNHFSVLDAREAIYRALTLKARFKAHELVWAAQKPFS